MDADVTFAGLALSTMLVAVAAVISRWRGLGLERDMAIATLHGGRHARWRTAAAHPDHQLVPIARVGD